MLTEICAEIRNYFTDDKDKHIGSFSISGGSIAPSDFIQPGQYIRIIGSVFNDGVHKYPSTELQDEDFQGAVWAMKVPPSLVALASEIEKYNENNQPGGYTSESFAGYSYSKATDAHGAPLTWQAAFRTRLNRWRRII